VKIDKAVPQRPGHREVHTALRRRIPRCDDDPSIRKQVFAEPAVEYELHGANVKKLITDVVGYLGDDPGLADAACTPSMPTERICMPMILLEPANKIAYRQRSISGGSSH
jgi:hypothetical protein